ncbi:MAG TPA: hypothetical protein V6D22_12385 [Candidatus Obscuribacterales bacterium]
MTEAKPDLNSYITRVQKANSAKDVLSVLDEFRPLPWSDDERARMAKAYVRILERVGAPAVENKEHVEEEADNGPVWYEKM